MSRHLADKRAPSDGGRVKHFLQIARKEGSNLWRRLTRATRAPQGGRRTAEYARIERGREV